MCRWACSVCPDCGGNLGEARREIVSITDITAEPRPEVRRYAVETRDCGQCGRKVRGQHPRSLPVSRGRPHIEWGHTSRRLAHILHYRAWRTPCGRPPPSFEDLDWLAADSGSDHAGCNEAGKDAVGATYEALRATVQGTSP